MLVLLPVLGNIGRPKSEFHKTLWFDNYVFKISTNDSGAVRKSVLEVYRKSELLIILRQKIDGYIVNAEVDDLDRNGSPEIYFYSASYGSGSFGKIYGFEFFPTSFDAIHTEPLTKAQANGYMGHDRYAIENGFLMRRFPIYKSGDANAYPSGPTRLVRYQLTTTPDKKLLLKSYF